MRTDTRPSGFGAVAPFDVEGPPPPTPSTDAAALAVVVRALWRARYWVLASAIFGGVAAAVYGSRQPQMYRAAVTFLVRAQTEGGSVNLLPFRVLLMSPQLSRGVSKEMGIDFSIDIVENKDANILTAFVTLADQARAAAVANHLAKMAVMREREMHQQQGTYTRDVIKSQMDEARERMHLAEKNLVAFRTATRLEVVKSDIERLLKDRGEIIEVERTLAASRARLEAAKSALAGQERVLTLDRTIGRNSALAEVARESGAPGVVGLSLKEEHLNTAYDDIAKAVAEYAADVAGAERKRETMLRQGARVPETPQLIRLYQAEAEKARFEAEVELTQRIHTDLSARYEQARVNISNKLGQLEILEAADSGVPVSRSQLRNVILGIMAAVALAVFGVLVLVAVRQLRPMLEA